MKTAPVRLRWALPYITMVVAAIAIPIEWRWSGQHPSALSLTVTDIPDIIENISGFLPVGIIFGRFGFGGAVGAATLLSTAAELSQNVMAHRAPSVVDVATNALGAMLGVALRSRWRIRENIYIDSYRATIAAALVLAIIVAAWFNTASPINERGATAPGVLEAHWRLDEQAGRVAADVSGYGLNGRFKHETKHVRDGSHEGVELDGKTNFVTFGHRSAFRMAGSMTLSAWIKSSRYPVDDAAIISTHAVQDEEATGFQLDTTIDRGPRTIGFKIANECGELVARYGTTPLALDVWYYVAGVYDARAGTMDVYLNGESDNGFLLGQPSGSQYPSRTALYVGRRGDRTSYEFAGVIGDVRVYSRALTQAEILADMRGPAQEHRSAPPAVPVSAGTEEVTRNRFASCRLRSDYEDVRLPAASAALGVLVAVSCVGFWPAAGAVPCVLASVFAGLILVFVGAPSLPAMNSWLIPLTAMAGGAAVAASIVRTNDSSAADRSSG